MANLKHDRCGRLAATALLFLFVAGCADPTPPEERVRNFIDEVETLAEEREYTELLDRIAGDYLDSRGNDKLNVAAILRGFYLRNKQVHLLIRIGDISFPAPEHASVTVYVGMARRPLTEEEEAGMPITNLHRVDIALVEDGDSYEVIQTEWQTAGALDFIG
jgi:hypothetical protein